MALSEADIQNLPVAPENSKAFAGKDTLLYVAKTSTPLEWILVGGQKNAPISEKADSLDATDKSAGLYSIKIPGMHSWSIDYDGLYVKDNEAVDILRELFLSNKPAYIRVEYADGSYRQGWAAITAMSDSNDVTAVHTLKITLEGYGALSDLIATTDAAITKPTVTVTKTSVTDQIVAVTPNDITIRGVVDASGQPLEFDTDYSFAEGQLTFTKEYLSTLPVGATKVTAKFATISIVITITVSAGA